MKGFSRIDFMVKGMSENGKTIMSSVLGRLDMNKAVGFMYLNTLVQLLMKGLVTVYFMLVYLSPKEQGLWYAFSSLAALTIFADLGLANMIMQFVSHIYSRLEFNEGRISGEPYEIDRLFSLVRFSVKIYTAIILPAIFLLTVVGFYFFLEESLLVLAAFIIFSLSGGLGLFAIFLQSTYQGLDRIAEVQKTILKSSIISPVVTWLLLFSGFNVWALVIGSCVNVFLFFYFLYKTAPGFWSQLISHKPLHEFQWFKKIAPVQGKIAVSTVSGYLIFQMYVPVVYKVEGAVTAGQLGLTLMIIIVAVTNSSLAWAWSKVPAFNILVANHQREELHRLVRKSIILSGIFYGIGSFVMLAAMYLMSKYHFYGDRFLDIPTTILMLFWQFEMILLGPLAIYTRAHLDDPWYVVVFTQGILTVLAIFTILPLYGLFYLMVVINIIVWFVAAPLGLRVFYRVKTRYDREPYVFPVSHQAKG